MPSLSLEGIKVLRFRFSFFDECTILSSGRLQVGLSLNHENVSLLSGLSHLSVCKSLSLVDDLDNLGLNMRLGCVLFTLNLSDEDVTNLLSLNNCDFLVSYSRHSQLVLLNLCSVYLRLQILHFSIICSLHVSKFLVLLILQCKFLIAILFDMVGQHVSALGSFFECLSKSLIDMDISDIAIFEDDSEESEFLVKISDHLTGHISFEIEDLTQPDTVDEVSDTLVYLCIEELVKATCT